ncbi:MAG: adenylate cyclase [Chthoniobacter sp.]|jgi:adenylate cyclase|nr:adenylate cyclase [Chthoniobacter sp.]
MPPESAQTPWLEDNEGQRFPLAGTSSLGRSSTVNRYGFPHEKVSRRHVLIHAQEGGEFWIVDLGSTNGTYINGERLLAPVRLKNGDAVTLGHGVELRFRQPAGGEQLHTQSLLASTAHDVREENRFILVADLAGYSTLSKTMPASGLALHVGEWLAASTDLINKHGGRINKYTGDGFLAYWREHSDVTRWVAAAVRDFRELHSRTNLAFRTVLHWGQVAVGGAPSMGEESLISDDLSLAFRLESLASALRLPFLASAAAAERLEKEITLELVPGSHPVKGFGTLTGLRTLR